MENLISLYEAFSNPVAAALALSVLLEQFAFIKDSTTANWKKLAVVGLTGVVWQLVAILFGVLIGRIAFNLTVGSLFAAVVAGLTMASGMAVFNYAVNLLPVPIRDFILALFGRNTITVTATSVTGNSSTSSEVKTATVPPPNTTTAIEGAIGDVG